MRHCETARQAFFSASPRYFDFLDCGTEISKCFECERKNFRLLNLVESYNEALVQSFRQQLRNGWDWKFDYNTILHYN